jgi:transketolase
MKKANLEELQKIAIEIRKEIIKMLVAAGSGHPAGSLGIADVFTALYFHILNHDPRKPEWEERDRLILSNGHVCPARYAAMAYAGYFPVAKLASLRKLGSPLQGHPERTKLRGLETTSGPLGCGLAQAVGIALAGRIDNKRFRVFCITSDGEHDSGGHWEAVLLAAKYKLSNLTCFVDRNNIQIDGMTEKVLPLEPLRDKYEAFNWQVIEIDGHDMTKIIEAVAQARATYDMPTMIIAQTVPGKGVSFMEGKSQWHGKVPNKKEAQRALEDLALWARQLKKKKINA